MDEYNFLKIALAKVQIALSFSSCDFPVAVQFFPQITLSSMRLPIQIEISIIVNYSRWDQRVFVT